MDLKAHKATLAILALANREWAWPLGRIETAVEALTVVGTAVVLLVGTRLRTRLSGVAAPVAIGTAAALLGLTLPRLVLDRGVRAAGLAPLLIRAALRKHRP